MWLGMGELGGEGEAGQGGRRQTYKAMAKQLRFIPRTLGSQ